MFKFEEDDRHKSIWRPSHFGAKNTQGMLQSSPDRYFQIDSPTFLNELDQILSEGCPHFRMVWKTPTKYVLESGENSISVECRGGSRAGSGVMTALTREEFKKRQCPIFYMDL